MQTATLPAASVSNGHNYHGEKEMILTMNCIVLDKSGADGMRTLITVRVHVSKSKHENYCSVWFTGIRDALPWCAGHGKASGYGYHRPSAAMQEALDSAGIKLSEPIDGVGQQAMADALRAIARAAGYRKCLIVEN
jgi:hypothetical protein